MSAMNKQEKQARINRLISNMNEGEAIMPRGFKTYLVEKYLIEGSDFKTLQKNKKALSTEERSEVMSAKAVWHHGPNGEETPAVWKSENKDGSFTYVTHTHRAFNTANTLKGAINKYHSFIKGTS